MSETLATNDGSAEPVSTPGRAVNIALWAVQVLLAVFFAFTAINILTSQPEVVDSFAKIGLGQWFQYLTGVLELAGAIGLLIPRLCGMAALGLAGVMIGAVITHLTVLTPATAALVPALLGLVFVLIAWGRWSQTKTLLATLKR